MKTKKLLIISLITLCFLSFSIPFYYMSKSKKVTIKFDSRGGAAIKNIVVKKGKKVQLPIVSKEKHFFEGWTLDGKLVSSPFKAEKSVLLKAKWKNKEKYFKVIFDSDGGSLVEPIFVAKGEKLILSTEPTKEGYKFLAWKDSYSKIIENNSILNVDGEITLKATWTTKKDMEYYCPEFYTLRENKCYRVIRKAKICECPTGYEKAGNFCNKLSLGKIKCKYSNILGAGVYDSSLNVCYYILASCDEEGVWNYKGLCYAEKRPVGSFLEVYCEAGENLVKVGPRDMCLKKTNIICKCDTGYTDIKGRGCFKEEVINATVK